MTNDSQLVSAAATHGLFSALGEQLGLLGDRYDLVVIIGGSALLALGFVARPTRDVDVLALAYGDRLLPAKPLPGRLAQASARVARDFATRDELVAAARWSRTHDPSEPHREILVEALAYLGVTDADLGP